MENLLDPYFFSSISDHFSHPGSGSFTSGIQNFFHTFFTDHLSEAASGETGFLTVLSLILALTACFFGYKMIRFWISFVGFFLGAALGFYITLQFTEASYAVLGALAGALLTAFLAYKIYLVFIFIIFSFGIYFLSAACLPLEGSLLAAASVTLGVVVGILSVTYMRPAIIVITGLQSGLIAAGSLVQLVPALSVTSMIPLGTGIAVLGMMFQFITTKSGK